MLNALANLLIKLQAVLATIISVALRKLLLEVKLFKNYWDVSKIDGVIIQLTKYLS